MDINQKKEIRVRDEQADVFDSWYLQKGILFDWIERRAVISHLDLQKDDVVIDAGCGTGRLTLEIAKKCKKVYALDFSPKSIDLLNKKIRVDGIKNIETFVCDIANPFPINEKVDKILSIQVLQHIPTESGKINVLNNFCSYLKNGGKCVVLVYNFQSLFSQNFLKEGIFQNGLYYFRFNPQEIENLFSKSGFENILVRGCINFKGYSRLNKYNLYKLFYPLALFDIFLSKFKQSCLFGNFLIVKGFKKLS